LRVIINSNAYWAISTEQSRKALERILEWGRFEMAFSSDDFHLPYISFDHVENAARAAHELGIACWLGRVTYVGDSSRDAMLERAAQAGLQVTEQPLQYVGRARELITIQTTDVQHSYSPCFMGIIPTVLTDGRVSLCCAGAAHENPRLIVGDLNHQSFYDIVRAMQDDLVQNILRVGGPGILWRLAFDELPEPIEYRSKCRFCKEICQIPGLDDHLRDCTKGEMLAKLISLDLLKRTSAKSET
jgi:hypothetical protein